MGNEFQDLFSGHARDYAQFRPAYPDELYQYLSSVTNNHDCAWDCATGTGQSAVELAKFYRQVIATDASEKQISNAVQKHNIVYRVALADHSCIDSQSLDLITVAQALHWFNLATFTKEVQRVLKPDGILAVWTYNLMQVNPAVDQLIASLYRDVLGEYWSFERRIVENGYQDIEFPFQSVTPADFSMQLPWHFNDLMGYLGTWSAVKTYQKKNMRNPLDQFSDKLQAAWGDINKPRTVSWPLTVKVWRK